MALIWPLAYSEDGPCDALLRQGEAAVPVFEAAAVDYLWNWTRRMYGLRTVALRPCRARDTAGTMFWGRWHPAIVAGASYEITCGECGLGCRCDGGTASVKLPGPVASVTSVHVDGALLAPAAYRVDNGRILTRVDGGQWPTWQNLSLPTTEIGTWKVTYQLGVPVPVGGQVAAGVLACELAKAANLDATCRLPQRVQTVTRQGVTMAVLDSMNDIDSGHTGIWVIDSWVASVTRPPRAGKVYSVDVAPPGRVQTWP